MRNENYDKLVREAIERINRLPQEALNENVLGAKEGLEKVLAETDETNLAQYYKNIDEFLGVTMCMPIHARGLEYINGFWLTTNGLGKLTKEFDVPQKIELTKEEIDNIEGVNELPEGAEIVENVEVIEVEE